MTKQVTAKRVAALLVCVLMFFSIALITVDNVKAADERPTFEQYKASYYIDYSPYTYYKSNEFNLPYRSIVEECRSSPAFVSLLVSWEVTTFSLSDIDEKSMKKVGYYEAFLYDILYEGQDKKNISNELEKCVKGIEASSYKKMISVFNADKDLFKGVNKSTKIKDLSPEQLQKFTDGIKAIDDFKDALDIIGDIKDVLEFCSDCQDVIIKLSKVEAIQNLGPEYAEVLRQVSSKTSDWALKLACDNMAKICEGSITYEDCVALMFGELTLTTAVDLAFDAANKAVMTDLGAVGIGITAGQTAGKLLGEALFAGKSSFENYYEMAALYDFENNLRNVVTGYENSYSLSNAYKTDKNARLFNTSFEMLMKTFQLGCDLSAKYYKTAKLDGAVNQILCFFNGKREEEYKKIEFSLDLIKSDIAFVAEYANNELYNYYLSLTDEEVIEAVGALPVEIINSNDGKKYDSDTFTVWLKDFKDEIEPYNWYSVYEPVKLEKDLVVFGSMNLKIGSINPNGHAVNSGSLDLNGHTLTVYGDVIHEFGGVYINGGTLNVMGDYRVQNRTLNEEKTDYDYSSSNGYVIMDNENDYIFVKGDFCIQSQSRSSVFQSGKLEIKGDFYQNKGDQYSCNNFNAIDSHVVIFSGSDQQIIYFENPADSGFNILDLQNPNIRITNGIRDWKLDKNISLDSLTTYGTLNINGYKLTVSGDFIQNQGEIILNKGELHIENDFTIKGYSVDIDGGILKVEGNIIQESGKMLFDGGKAYIEDNYRIQTKSYDNSRNKDVYGNSEGTLTMNNDDDYLFIGKDFYTQSYWGTNGNTLTAGTMEIKGNFNQCHNDAHYISQENFAATGSHKVVLSGENTQILYFDDPMYSGFNNVELQNTSILIPNGIKDWKLDKDVTIDSLISYGKINVNSHSLTVTGDFIQKDGSILANDGQLHVKGSMIQDKGGLYINKGNVIIDSDYRIQSRTYDPTKDEYVYGTSNAYVVMENERDYIYVGGDFYTQSGYSSSFNRLIDGVLEIKGNFFQKEWGGVIQNNSDYNFDAEGNHTVILSGNQLQEISFDNPQSSGFNKLSLKNPSICITNGIRNWTLDTDVTIDTLTSYGTIDINGHKLLVTGDYIQKQGSLQLNGGQLSIQGSFFVENNNVDINGGVLIVQQDTVQEKGNMVIGGGKFYNYGNYRIQSKKFDTAKDEYVYKESEGALVMNNDSDYVLVGKDFYTQSYWGTNGNLLIAGVLEVKGNFTQLHNEYNSQSAYNFKATNSHKTILSGDQIQTVEFDDFENSCINNLELTKPKSTGYVFSPDPCWKGTLTELSETPDTDVKSSDIDTTFDTKTDTSTDTSTESDTDTDSDNFVTVDNIIFAENSDGTYSVTGSKTAESIVIPDTIAGKKVSSINTNAFKDNNTLKNVSIQKGVRSIGESAFENCYALEKVEIPASVIQIDGDAFAGCDKLTIYGLPNSYAEQYAEEQGLTFVDITSVNSDSDTDTTRDTGTDSDKTSDTDKQSEPDKPEIPDNTPKGTYGDLDGDEEITANDALTILRASVGMADLTPDQIAFADVDGDGDITANDALAVLRYSVGMGDGGNVGKEIA